MKKLKGQISFLPHREYTNIEIRDKLSGITFCEIKLTNDELASMLSRMANTSCEMEIRGLENVGKKQEHFQFEFEVPEEISYYGTTEEEMEKLKIHAQKLLDKKKEGWISEGYFRSQDSFFEKNGKHWARVTARRWVDVNE